MERKTKITNIVVIALAVTVVFMSIGFAAFAQQLNITGTATVKKAEWSVHFDTRDNAMEIDPDGVQPTKSTLTETDYTFEVTLDKPKDYFEVELLVANDGDFDAVLDKLEMGVTGDDNYSNYLTYTLTYDGTPYTETTTFTNNKPSLPSDSSATVKVRVDYNLPSESEKLPNADKTLQISGKLYYSAVQ